MLDSARQILVSELVLAKGIEEKAANNILDEVLA
jgi:RNA polymerase-interacting CarD/CdnL/TRCF family regulator